MLASRPGLTVSHEFMSSPIPGSGLETFIKVLRRRLEENVSVLDDD